MTLYNVRYKLNATGTIHERAFESMLERELFIITLIPQATILNMWLSVKEAA